jgi:hypothetical protein
MARSITARDISPHETTLIEWRLDHAAVRDIATYRTKPISALQVVGPVRVWLRKPRFPSESC